MSMTSSTNSSENLTPDERLILKSGVRKEPQGEESVKDQSSFDHLNQTMIVHNALNSQLHPNLLHHNNHVYSHLQNHLLQQENLEQLKVKNSTCYPLYENSNQYSASSKYLANNPSIRKNFTTILEVPRSSQTDKYVINKNNQINNLSLYDFQSFYNKQNQFKMNTIDNYANLPPPPPQYDNQNCSNFSNSNVYCNNSSNSSNNNSNTCLLESQNSNGSRSCSTTPESKSNEQLPNLSKSNIDLNTFNLDNTCFNQKNNNFLQNFLSNPNNEINLTEVDILRAENAYLKENLEHFFKKVSKLPKFELEIQKVHQLYEELILSSENKEKLERAVRYKLEIEIKRLQQQNKTLKDQVNAALSTISNNNKEDKENGIKKDESQKTDLLFSQLLSQNKELINTKERQEIELQAQRLTLEEQRNHIEILDSALMSAQNNVITLETNLRKKNAYEERANNLQKALTNLQLASDRRLQMEKRARSYLEKEIEMLKNMEKNKNNSHSLSHNTTEIENLKKLTREYEEKIITLEGEVSKWEQKYLEESTMRKIEVNAASVPKDAKIAALEKTSQQTEKLIAEARTECLRYMDELHEASKKTTELESSIKDLEAKLAEKDAMIKVLQQHSLDRDNVIQQSILAQRSSLGRHTRSVSSMGLVNSSNNTNTSNILSRNLKNLSISGTSTSPVNRFTDLTSSTSSKTSGYSSSSTNTSTSCSVTENKATTVIDEQLKEFDKRLTNKNSIIRALRAERERYPDRFFKV